MARRFLPSDFAIDLFTAPAGAPQFDLRRKAAEAIDALPMQVVHVLSGGFMDMMLDPAVPGLINLSGGTVMLWGTGDEPFDLTTVEDTARFTARVATDPADVSGVRYLSGERTTFNTIIAETERLTGTTLTRNLRPLMAMGLLQLDAGADARSRLVNITPAGREKRQEAQRRWRVAQEALNQRLGAARVVAA